MKPDGRRRWYAGWAGFALSVSLIAISLVALMLVGGSLYNLAPNDTANSALDNTANGAPDNMVTSNLVSFTCHLAYGDQAFIITADVNLTDWMNRDEAVLVANTVFDKALGQTGQLHKLKSADMDELGVWTVELTWGYSTTDLFHWFLAEIDPFNRTIVYGHCK